MEYDNLFFQIELSLLHLRKDLLVDEHFTCKDLARLKVIEGELKGIEAGIARTTRVINANREAVKKNSLPS